MVRPQLSVPAKARVKAMVELRDCVHHLIDLQLQDGTDGDIQAAQQQLNTLYDAFTPNFGLVNDKANRLAFSDDASYYLLCALEVLDQDGKLKRKADLFTKRTIRPQRQVTSVDTPSEALAVSLGERGRVDLSFMAELLGTPGEYTRITRELSGIIFRDPLEARANDPTAGWHTADDYLSGNVREKLHQAKQAAQQNPAYTVNVEALTAAQPETWTPRRSKPGWVPPGLSRRTFRSSWWRPSTRPTICAVPSRCSIPLSPPSGGSPVSPCPARTTWPPT